LLNDFLYEKNAGKSEQKYCNPLEFAAYTPRNNQPIKLTKPSLDPALFNRVTVKEKDVEVGESPRVPNEKTRSLFFVQSVRTWLQTMQKQTEK